MRDNLWLGEQLKLLLQKYFADVILNNPIEISFGREAKFRFGSIKLLKPRGLKIFRSDRQPQKSIITITSMFRDETIPVEVIEHTICHELCHYAHGFSSTNRRLFRHPHHGGVVDAELKKRGAGYLIAAYKKWLKGYRAQVMKERQKFL